MLTEAFLRNLKKNQDPLQRPALTRSPYISATDKAISKALKPAAAGFVWRTLPISSDCRHLSGIPAENGQTPEIFKAKHSNDGALTEVSFLVSAWSIAQNLSFQVGGGGAAMSRVSCKRGVRYYYRRPHRGRRLPPVLWDEEPNVSAH